MCTILFSYKTTPGYRLILAANRDEFLDRPTTPLAYWSDCKEVLAGRDLQAGGTWLGINKTGKIGAITNFREPQKINVDYSSRGEIVVKYLTQNGDSSDFLSSLAARTQDYRGFNVLIGDRDAMYYFSNRMGEILQLKPGVYGLSNHLLDSSWPKIKRGKRLFKRVLADAAVINIDNLFAVLGDTQQPPEALLPETGVGESWERLLSSIFITSEIYGTRSSAVITINDNGYTEFRERTYLHGGEGLQTGQERIFSQG